MIPLDTLRGVAVSRRVTFSRDRSRVRSISDPNRIAALVRILVAVRGERSQEATHHRARRRRPTKMRMGIRICIDARTSRSQYLARMNGTGHMVAAEKAINAYWFGGGARWQPITISLLPIGALLVAPSAAELVIGRANAAGNLFAGQVPVDRVVAPVRMCKRERSIGGRSRFASRERRPSSLRLRSVLPKAATGKVLRRMLVTDAGVRETNLDGFGRRGSWSWAHDPLCSPGRRGVPVVVPGCLRSRRRVGAQSARACVASRLEPRRPLGPGRRPVRGACDGRRLLIVASSLNRKVM